MRRHRRYLLAALLAAVAAPASAQSLGMGLGLDSVDRPAAGAVLDGVTAPAAAYSFRRVRSAYAGPAVKLRRTTGGTSDIGFTAGGDFDTAAAAAFCASTTCFLDTWYDQSGLARHATQGNGAQQPAYLADCGNALPCARTTTNQIMAGPSVTPAAGPASFSAVGRVDGAAAACGWIATASQSFTNNGTAWFLWNGSGFSVPASLTAWHVGIGVISSTVGVINIDGVETPGNITPVTTAGLITLATGDGSLPCSYREMVWWNNYALSPAERTALQQNQQQYWAPLPLDTFATPAAAYSMRRLKSSYAGPAIRLRRASDNAETDINFLGFTGFTGAPIDTAAANAHCAATTCFATVWYDQSGNTRHVVQSAPANQPAFVFNCQNGLPCLQSTAAGMLLLTGTSPAAASPLSISAVARTVSSLGAYCFLAYWNTNQFYSGPFSSQWTLGGTGSLAAGATDSVWHAGQGVINGAASVINIDGVETTGTSTVVVGATPIQTVSSNAATDFRMTEMVVWNAYALTAGERAALQSNQKSFWGTP